MLSLRNLSRTAMRQASRLSAKQQPSASAAARRSLSTTTTTTTSYSGIYRTGALRQTASRITSLLPSRAAFSTTQAIQQTQEGQVDGELAAKLQEEYNLEEEMGVVDELPSHLKSFLDESGFVVTETPGSEEVVLTRQFGSETIKVSFSTADLDAFDPEDDAFSGEDGALADEGGDLSGSGAGGAAAGAPKGGAAAAAAAEQQAAFEGEDADVEDPDAGFPARIDVTVEKPGVEGAMQFAATVNDGQVVLENIYYFPQRAAADAQSAEADWQRRALYTGPPYGNLDPDLQVLLERYLDERGVNTGLAVFIPEYIDFKEQREYLAWLQNLKNFVDA